MRYPARYSPAAPPPCHTNRTTAKARPSEIHTADSVAASLKVMAWAVRWTSSRSAMRRTARVATSAPHTHSGTGNDAKSPAPDDAAARTEVDMKRGSFRLDESAE